MLKSGEILSLDTRSSRSVSRIIWNANSLINKEKKEDFKKLDTRRESSSSDDDNIEDEYESDTGIKMRDDNLVIITKIKWLAPQTATNTNNSEGCYFLLLSSKINSTVVGLTPAGPHGNFIFYNVDVMLILYFIERKLAILCESFSTIYFFLDDIDD